MTALELKKMLDRHSEEELKSLRVIISLEDEYVIGAYLSDVVVDVDFKHSELTFEV